MPGLIPRAALIAVLFLVAAILPNVARAQSATTSTELLVHLPAISYPGGVSLLHRSLTAVRISLHTAHGIQTTTAQDTAQHQKSTLQLDGDCALTPSSLAVHTTWSGRLSGGPRFSNEFVVMASLHASHTWSRSVQTHNRWIDADFAQIGDAILVSCPSLLLRQIGDLHPLDNRGPVTVDGHATWHLHNRTSSSGGAITRDLYLDRTSLYPVRLLENESFGSHRSTVLTRYTTFNSPVHIQAPIVHPTPPPPFDARGVTVTVTPNPMPANASPSLTVTAASGSRCSARVVYSPSPSANSPPVPAAIVTIRLGTKPVGSSNTVSWRFHLRGHGRAGNAIVDCARGRSSTNQVASFFTFS